ncbi:LysR substrate-binding domain-containing protein [Burkholderia paludis]|uniref:LysR substrate-binding domain-containing protein n=1 Tax=Burkholderia paludis TaxID=1506587 RepID=UPI00068F8842
MSAAANGLGVILQSQSFLADDVAAGRLVRLFPEHELPGRPMYLVDLLNRRKSFRLQSFIDFAIDPFTAWSFAHCCPTGIAG